MRSVVVILEFSSLSTYIGATASGFLQERTGVKKKFGEITRSQSWSRGVELSIEEPSCWSASGAVTAAKLPSPNEAVQWAMRRVELGAIDQIHWWAMWFSRSVAPALVRVVLRR